MRFSVPQYITIEDKLMGLVTFKQLFLLLGAFFTSFIAFKILPSFFALVIAFIAFPSAIALGWLQINGKLLLNALPEVFEFFFSAFRKKYLWRPMPGITVKSIEIPVIEKYFPVEEAEAQEIKFTKKVLIKRIEPELPVETAVIKKEPLQIETTPAIEIAQTIPDVAEQKKEINKNDLKKSQPLIKYIQYAHKHNPNPFNPYRYFPLPHFPTTKYP